MMLDLCGAVSRWCGHKEILGFSPLGQSSTQQRLRKTPSMLSWADASSSNLLPSRRPAPWKNGRSNLLRLVSPIGREISGRRRERFPVPESVFSYSERNRLAFPRRTTVSSIGRAAKLNLVLFD